MARELSTETGGQGRYGPGGPKAGRRLTEVGDVDDLYLALRRAKIGNPNCDGDTMVVIDLPDGTSWTVASLAYEEDLAGALVLKAGRELPGWDPERAGGLTVSDIADNTWPPGQKFRPVAAGLELTGGPDAATPSDHPGDSDGHPSH
jgi:hypothetical protein